MATLEQEEGVAEVRETVAQQVELGADADTAELVHAIGIEITGTVACILTGVASACVHPQIATMIVVA